MNKFMEILRMIKIEHTVFALPFALLGMIFAAKGIPDLKTFTLVILCTLFARNAAMAFNRYLDADIDAKNPRTKDRSIPAGRLSRFFVLVFVIVNSILFIGTTYFLNSLAFKLSPIAIFIVLFYSYTKRFTSFSHLVLGLADGIAPAGGWIAVTGKFDFKIIFLSLAVMLWVAGFDIFYSLQDIEFDRSEGLYSLPSRIGVKKALYISRFFHFIVVVCLFYFGYIVKAGMWYWIGLSIASLLLFYEHTLVKENDLSKIDQAFFTVNGFFSVIILIFATLDFYL
ncbi:4-hydroxybenzoate octaprenyltransferase [Thermotomaculum hydrothermale]|uniref:4-hydroxybenzoate polyprenyltransferase n=1 Tax=Thermotomaculum hydrothermale TaxID=981385 RepID=A0A7R6PYV4_9BACT|nr:UbiA-like polyprenyltransferase [Thermotomaculum hydrothermale]BBB32173.1 4-hydroxybenzoate octaprenyltransferase [Thermotomaculum hydrothermale]